MCTFGDAVLGRGAGAVAAASSLAIALAHAQQASTTNSIVRISFISAILQYRAEHCRHGECHLSVVSPDPAAGADIDERRGLESGRQGYRHRVRARVVVRR